jgi:hypothetical protein
LREGTKNNAKFFILVLSKKGRRGSAELAAAVQEMNQSDLGDTSR